MIVTSNEYSGYFDTQYAAINTNLGRLGDVGYGDLPREEICLDKSRFSLTGASADAAKTVMRYAMEDTSEKRSGYDQVLYESLVADGEFDHGSSHNLAAVSMLCSFAKKVLKDAGKSNAVEGIGVARLEVDIRSILFWQKHATKNHVLPLAKTGENIALTRGEDATVELSKSYAAMVRCGSRLGITFDDESLVQVSPDVSSYYAKLILVKSEGDVNKRYRRVRRPLLLPTKIPRPSINTI
jgi:hypothetical protein